MSSSYPDPIRAGLARCWRVLGGTHGAVPERITCDVAIVGTGAGGGVSAELLANAGLDVVLVEEGPLKSSSDFRQLESDAYPTLYQESAGRKTADKAITILQGRCVGGSTTVNWTSSFRTPPDTLRVWRERFGLAELTDGALSPWFLQAERRLSVGPWLAPPNENNDLLRRGALKLGIAAPAILRNVRGCANLGSCGMGCPTNAKQSMLVTTVPAALDKGARLLVETHAERFAFERGRASVLHARSAGRALQIVARPYVGAGGAITAPALLRRSDAPDPHKRLGTRTFLHPVVISAATFEQNIAGWDGAPQTIYSDHFLDTQPVEGPIGYKLEAPPIHPLIFALTLPGFGADQAAMLRDFARTHALLALLRDGFHEQSPGGRVTLRGDGSPLLDYPLTDFVMDGARRAMLSMAEIQFAAGARSVVPGHEMGGRYTSWAQARAAIAELPMKPLLTRVVSAHVMGGCGMAGRDTLGSVRPDGVHWQVDNLSVHDGSLFPTSIGANPQLSIYGLVNKLASGLARKLGARDVQLG